MTGPAPASAPGASLGAALIWCPFPDSESAARAAGLLLHEGLIGCANILPPMRSLYGWRGELGEAAEIGVVFKTDAALLDRAVQRISEVHPYDTPAVLGWKADAASPATGEWLGELVQGQEAPDGA